MSRGEPQRPGNLDEESRRAINRELGEARSVLAAIRNLYLGMAFLTAIVLLAWFLPSAQEELSPVGLAVLLGLIGLELTGAWRATKEPLLWSIPPALVHSGLVRRRGWHEGLPALGEVAVEAPGSTQAQAVFTMGEDTLETRWEWQEHRWTLRMFGRRIGGEDPE